MDRQRETGMVVIFGMVLMLIIAISALCSCTTKQKVITEYVTVHDTIRTHHTDTIKDVKVVTHTDTIRQLETHTITLNNVGDTIREIHHYYDTQKTIIVDSTDRYRATVDSLRSALIKEQNKYKQVTKTKSVVRWWEWLLIIGIVAGLVYGVKMMKSS